MPRRFLPYALRAALVFAISACAEPSATTEALLSPSTLSVAADAAAPVEVVAAAGFSNCALRADRTALCWGDPIDGTGTAPDQFTFLSAGWFHYCGIRPDKTLACWGSYNWNVNQAPEGQFVQVASGRHHSCGIRVDGTALCWGDPGLGRGAVPPGTYKKLTLSETYGCGLHSDDELVCWGTFGAGQGGLPQGKYRDVSASYFGACAIRMDYTIVCAGAIDAPPAGPFARLAVGGDARYECALRADGSVACWGQADGGAVPPDDRFLYVTTAESHACGVTIRRSIVCWPNGGTVPSELQHVNSAPTAVITGNLTSECVNGLGTFTLDGSSSSDADGSIASYLWTGPSTSTDAMATLTAPLGTSLFTLTVTDDGGASGSAQAAVSVLDTKAPAIGGELILSELWPADHRMHLVASGIRGSDACRGDVNISVQVSSNESPTVVGAGQTEGDWTVLQRADGSYDVYVRAERSGTGSGRTYTILASATDLEGLTGTRSFSVYVPHSRRP
jgi:hypothetical protein